MTFDIYMAIKILMLLTVTENILPDYTNSNLYVFFHCV